MRHFKRLLIIAFLLLGGCQVQESVCIKEGVANVSGVKLGWTRCYLLKCTDGYLLIDTDYPQYYARFEKKLAKLGIKTSDIKYLLLTHHHDDHAGFAAELVRRTGCRVIAHRDAVSPLKQGKSEETIKPVNRRVRIALAFYATFYTLFHGEWNFPPLTLTERDIIIEGDDDDFLKAIGIDGVILHTPGHTGDSISVLLSDGSAFAGDAAMNFLRWTGVGHRPIAIEDINTVYESWRKLRERGARVIYPSHGRPFPAKEMRGRQDL
jgi:glyoxylase-like metal-dependent hydrolase (beta-lactamase superfamily II)